MLSLYLILLRFILIRVEWYINRNLKIGKCEYIWEEGGELLGFFFSLNKFYKNFKNKINLFLKSELVYILFFYVIILCVWGKYSINKKG